MGFGGRPVRAGRPFLFDVAALSSARRVRPLSAAADWKSSAGGRTDRQARPRSPAQASGASLTSPRALTRQTVDDMDSVPKLTVEIIPTSLHGKNPRTVMGRRTWERQRKLVCEAAGNRCEICGGVGKRHTVQIHERYEYDETCTPPCQRVIGLIALCPDCHAVKHLFRTKKISVQQNDPSIYLNALRHLARVNEWDPERVKSYLAETAETFQRRQALGAWSQDFSLLLDGDQ
jgi:hypothetical protein